MQTDPVLNQLSAMLSIPTVLSKLAPILKRVESSLTANPDQPQAWEPLPVDLFGSFLPTSIKSCWVFVLRGGGVFGAERHPNSHQRTVALRGSAFFEVYTEGDWAPRPIDSGSSSVEGKAVSIPAGVWHRIKIGSSNFISVSFHTAVAQELIEETPVNDDLSVTQQRRYHA